MVVCWQYLLTDKPTEINYDLFLSSILIFYLLLDFKSLINFITDTNLKSPNKTLANETFSSVNPSFNDICVKAIQLT
jgi:hypothetical protein